MDETKTPVISWRRKADTMPFPEEIDRLGQALAEVQAETDVFPFFASDYERLPDSQRAKTSRDGTLAAHRADRAIRAAQDAITGVAKRIDPFLNGKGLVWTTELKQSLANMRGMLIREGWMAVRLKEWATATMQIHEKRCFLANADYSAIEPGSDVQSIVLHLHNIHPNVPLPAAFAKFMDVLNAVAYHAVAGWRIADDAGAQALNQVTPDLHNALARKLHEIYSDSNKSADPLLVAALTRAVLATGFSVERHNENSLIDAMLPYNRWQAGDVVCAEDIASLESVGRILQLLEKSNSAALADTRPSEQAKPHYDNQSRELKFNGHLVKHLKQRAPNQERVFAAFEEEQWPSHIDDPLPAGKRDNVIKSLNRNMRVNAIRFVGDGTGERIGWERVPTAPP